MEQRVLKWSMANVRAADFPLLFTVSHPRAHYWSHQPPTHRTANIILARICDANSPEVPPDRCCLPSFRRERDSWISIRCGKFHQFVALAQHLENDVYVISRKTAGCIPSGAGGKIGFHFGYAVGAFCWFWMFLVISMRLNLIWKWVKLVGCEDESYKCEKFTAVEWEWIDSGVKCLTGHWSSCNACAKFYQLYLALKALHFAADCR